MKKKSTTEKDFSPANISVIWEIIRKEKSYVTLMALRIRLENMGFGKKAIARIRDELKSLKYIKSNKWVLIDTRKKNKAN